MALHTQALESEGFFQRCRGPFCDAMNLSSSYVDIQHSFALISPVNVQDYRYEVAVGSVSTRGDTSVTCSGCSQEWDGNGQGKNHELFSN